MNGNSKDDITAVIRYKNAVVRIHGRPPEDLPEIMTDFMKKVMQQRPRQAKEQCYT